MCKHPKSIKIEIKICLENRLGAADFSPIIIGAESISAQNIQLETSRRSTAAAIRLACFTRAQKGKLSCVRNKLRSARVIKMKKCSAFTCVSALFFVHSARASDP
jgi:hypothetical protein